MSTAAWLTGVSARRTHEPVGHNSPWTLWICPVCGTNFREGATEPGGCCSLCADNGWHVMPVRGYGPRRMFKEESL